MSSKKKSAKSEKMVAATDSKESGSVSSGVFDGIRKEKVSRRTFLKGTVAAAAVVGVSGAVIGKSRLASSQSTVVATQQTDPFASQNITLNVNGVDYPVTVEPRDMLVNVIREQIGLIGTKRPCNRMECGGCSILIDGVPYNSCQYIALRAIGKKILTTEAGVASTAAGAPAPDPIVAALQSAFVEDDGGQCGFCSPGEIMTATALLKQNPNPTVDEIKAALAGNLCRCGDYPNIIASVQLAAKNLGGA
ncbi:MAG: (2Fe-2S)-binding protein [Nitrososphaerota archaeon]|nr:(2Fe-2S)-binding protein [Nitrososphaerota archaeon]